MKQLTVLHLIYRFDVGGLESVIVNMINTLPTENFKHLIVPLTDASEQMQNRINVDNVEIIQLHKKPGNDFGIYKKLWSLFKQHQPDIVHSYNIATLEYQFVAFLAGVPLRIHAEHGRDIYDLDGSNKKYQLLRKIVNPFIHYWIPVSKELEQWLIKTLKVSDKKVKLIYNGIDLALYKPKEQVKKEIFTVAAVGRTVPVKNQLMLIKAVEFLLTQPDLKNQLRLIIVGNGDLLPTFQSYILENQLQKNIELLGSRNDVAAILQTVDLFVLPSLAEGIALTLLEAMATGLPVIATDVGGNPELITDSKNGFLISSQNKKQLANVILNYYNNPELCKKHGIAAQKTVEEQFSLSAMTKKYLTLYENLKC